MRVRTHTQIYNIMGTIIKKGTSSLKWKNMLEILFYKFPKLILCLHNVSLRINKVYQEVSISPPLMPFSIMIVTVFDCCSTEEYFVCLFKTDLLRYNLHTLHFV